MLDHIGIKVSNIKESKRFYLMVLETLGFQLTRDTETSVAFGVLDGFQKSTDPGGEFWLSIGQPNPPLVHFAFSAESRDCVNAFFRAGIAAGGIDNGKPGLRLKYHRYYYASYLVDPDGYNIEAVFHGKV